MDISTAHLYPKTLRLLELWLDSMIVTLADTENRTASDFANARQFFKDNNILVDKPLPRAAPKVVSDGILKSADVDLEETPSFMREAMEKTMGPPETKDGQ